MSNFKKITNGLTRGVTTVQSGILYVITVVCMALFSLGALGYELWPGADLIIVGHLERLDLAVAYIFLLDFFLGLFFNNTYASGKHYAQANWLDFVSSIPVTSEATQLLRVLRIWRASKILRAALGIWTAKQQIAIHKKRR